MDKESLILIINNFDKKKFEQLVKLVLQDVLKINAVNGDSLIIKKGAPKKTAPVLYILLIDKCASIDSALLKKKIREYNVEQIYFFFRYNINDAELRRKDLYLEEEYDTHVTCMCSSTLAEFIIDSNMEDKLFSDGVEYCQIRPSDVDYLTAAFHAMTIFSTDVNDLKGKVYDDAILFKVSSKHYKCKEELTNDVLDFLQLPKEKDEIIMKRIDSLLSRGQMHKESVGFVLLSSVENDIEARKKAYLYELGTLTSAQIELMRDDYKVDWTKDDSKKIAMLLSFSALDNQIRILREAKTKIDHPIFKMAKGSEQKIIKYFTKEKGLDEERAHEAFEKFAKIAATHPLIIKITRACIYLALEGSNPLSSAQALGASKWKDFCVMLEPTVAIPYICSQLYTGGVTKLFEKSIISVQKAITLTSKVSIPSSYINECAGHLLAARNYQSIELDPVEMVYSNNAFVSNYFSLYNSGCKLPPSFLDYLATFSSAIKTERSDIKGWVREIMTDMSSLLMKGNVNQENIPLYNDEDLKDYENEYSLCLRERNKEKPEHLVHHDTIALKYTNDKVIHDNEHWIILSYDGILTRVGSQPFYKGWICSPIKFLELTNISRQLSETQMVSILHSVASFSERTLAVGAKIMDRIVQYASPEMQTWEFKQELDLFKREMKESLHSNDDIEKEIIMRTDKFLKDRGIVINEEEIEITISN
jgi:hypothetical protein